MFLSVSTLAWRRRIQGLLRCCVFLEGAQRKLSNRGTSNGRQGRGEQSSGKMSSSKPLCLPLILLLSFPRIWALLPLVYLQSFIFLFLLLQVLVSMVMEEVMSYFKEKVFPRIIVHHRRRRKAWIRVSEKDKLYVHNIFRLKCTHTYA